MRVVRLSLVLLGLTVSTAHAQRIHDFGFSAGMSAHPRAGSPQLSAAMTLGLGRHAIELAVGSSSDDSFLAANRVWTFARLSYGAGLAVLSSAGGTRPGIGGTAAFAIPIAPRASAAFQLIARGIAVSGATSFSLGAGMRLAPLRGGLMVGERVAQPREYADVARSWEVIVAQIMLLDNGASSITAIEAGGSALLMRFEPVERADLLDDVARIARILAASTEPLRLVVNAPEPIWISAAVTSGGFPAERLTMASAPSITIQVLRAPVASTNRSEQP